MNEHNNPNGKSPLISVEIGFNPRIVVGKHTNNSGCTSTMLHAITGRRVSSNIYEISVGSWVSFTIHGVEFQVWPGEHEWCKDIRDAIKVERDAELTDLLSVETTNTEAMKLAQRVFSHLSMSQFEQIMRAMAAQGFNDGWRAKERQISQMFKTIMESPVPVNK